MLHVTKPPDSKGRSGATSGVGDLAPMPPLITGNENPPIPCRICVGCGFIYSLAEFEKRSQCGFCNRPMSTIGRKENRRRREEGEDEEGLAKAEALKNRLVAYDRESAARTKVTDDDQA